MRRFRAWIVVLLPALVFTGNLAAQDEQDLEQKLAKANELFEEQNWEEAAAAFREVVKIDEQNATAWFRLAYSLHAAGELDDAIKAHKRAAEFEQLKGIATYNLGCAYALQGDKDQAFKALGAAVQAGFRRADQFATDPDLDSLRDDERFVALMKQVNSDDSEHGEAEGEHGEGEHEQAGGKQIEVDVDELMDEGGQFLRSGDFEKAAEIYAKVTKADPENGMAWFQLGYCLHAAGELDKAIEVHKKASKFERVGPIAMYNLGCAWSLKDDKDEAFKALNAAVDMGFTDVAQFRTDTDLDNLRDDDRYEQLIKKAEQKAQEKAGGIDF